MAQQVLTDLDFNSAARVLNLPDPTLAQHAATKAYVDSAVEGLAWKDSARVATQANINLASPGATIDGVTMATSDRVLVRSQTTTSENGIYIWNGAATPMTRALDANTAAELEQAVVTVEEGTSAAATFRQTAINFTLGSGAVSWVSFGTSAPAATETTAGIAEIATQAETDTGTDDTRFVTPLKLATYAGRLRRVSQTIGDGSATQYTITHNLNTRDVHVQVFRTSGAFDEVLVDKEATTVNSVTIRFAAAPALNAFRAVILG
ncbi:hypothetical protein [Gemmatimonas sp.]|uniref:hypothetical protein n=1 Tax=Gemmatimonas sp. TaxID=1962908 RepID=UPI0025C6BE74|nr:hypothetical protein [Gemmatimonas sp.]MCA2992059.1 hypothetical protein [Gemmatimonas sp.]